MSLPLPNPAIPTNSIQTLMDLPNDTEGLTPGQLKAKFDKFAVDWMDFYLNVLAPAGASLQDLIGLTLGQIPDGTITAAKIAAKVLTAAQIANGGLNDVALFPNDLITEAKMAAAMKKAAGGVAPYDSLADGWLRLPQCTYVSDTSFSMVGNWTEILGKGNPFKAIAFVPYSNDPAPGSNIMLNMVTTHNITVGNRVKIVSTVGEEWATVTAVVPNVSITVDTLVLNHSIAGAVYTTKWAPIIAVSYSPGTNLTTVTINGGSKFLLHTGLLTAACYYSKMDNPYGYPVWFEWVPTVAGFSSVPASGVYLFKISADECTLEIRQPNDGTSNATTFTISLPVTPTAITGMAWQGSGAVIDNGVSQTTPGFLYIVASTGTVLNIYKTWTSGAFTASGGKRLNVGRISYRY